MLNYDDHPAYISPWFQDPIQKDTILLNYCIDDIEAKCRKLRESRAQVIIHHCQSSGEGFTEWSPCSWSSPLSSPLPWSSTSPGEWRRPWSFGGLPGSTLLWDLDCEILINYLPGDRFHLNLPESQAGSQSPGISTSAIQHGIQQILYTSTLSKCS